MKKKYIILTLVLLIIASVAIIGFTAGSLGDTKISNLESNDALTIMVHDGSTYVKQDTVPVGGDYTFNETKSYCEGGSKLGSYDSTLGTIKHTLIGDDKCVIYFDKQLTLSQTVIAKLSDSDYTSSQDGTPYRVADQNGIRYEGADPDNYVTYNDEKWRIIGVFDGTDIGLDPNKKYTKIVRGIEPFYESFHDEPIDNGMNYIMNTDWTKATLNTLLNNDYLNQTGKYSSSSSVKGLNKVARGMIAQYNGNYSTWYLRGTEDNQALTADDWYSIEHVTGSPGAYNLSEIGSPTTTGAIALIYPSDFAYAMYAGKNNEDCINTTVDTTDMSVNCSYYHNWIHNIKGGERYGWFLSPVGVANIRKFAYSFDEWDSCDYSNYVFPTLYLESSILAVDGDGSKDDPYILQDNRKEPEFYLCRLSYGSDLETCKNNPVADNSYTGLISSAYSYWYVGEGDLSITTDNDIVSLSVTENSNFDGYIQVGYGSGGGTQSFNLKIQSAATENYQPGIWTHAGAVEDD